MNIHQQLINDFKAIQKRIAEHAAADAAARRPVRNVLIHQVNGKCDGAIAILENDARNAGLATEPEKAAAK